jgi:hypothetical protein
MRLPTLLSFVLLSTTGLLVAQRGMAQSLAACEPPQGEEYLLLVVKQDTGTEEQLQQLLPLNAALSTCNYLDDEVVRVGGFASSEIANAWAQYLTDMTGLQAFVARPSSSAAEPAVVVEPVSDTTPSETTPSETSASFPTPTQVSASGGTSSSPSQQPSQQPEQQQGQTDPSEGSAPTSTPETPTPEGEAEGNGVAAASPSGTNQAYSPQPLGSGYAVLVHYFNRPEVAADVSQVTSQPVGLVAYEQRPFLLAAYTTDASAAATILQSLSERGFTAVIVDSRRAILLTPSVIGTAGQS